MAAEPDKDVKLFRSTVKPDEPPPILVAPIKKEPAAMVFPETIESVATNTVPLGNVMMLSNMYVLYCPGVEVEREFNPPLTNVKLFLSRILFLPDIKPPDKLYPLLFENTAAFDALVASPPNKFPNVQLSIIQESTCKFPVTIENKSESDTRSTTVQLFTVIFPDVVMLTTLFELTAF